MGNNVKAFCRIREIHKAVCDIETRLEHEFGVNLNECILLCLLSSEGSLSSGDIAEKMGLEDCRFFADKTVDGIECGSGVIGCLPEAVAGDDFVLMLKRTFDVECVQCNQLLRRPIKTVAVCGGAGSFLLGDAIAAGADAFVTGEMHYHEYFGHEQEIQIAVIGHYQSEQFTNEIFKEIIEERCDGVKTYLTKTNTNPIIYL